MTNPKKTMMMMMIREMPCVDIAIKSKRNGPWVGLKIWNRFAELLKIVGLYHLVVMILIISYLTITRFVSCNFDLCLTNSVIFNYLFFKAK